MLSAGSFGRLLRRAFRSRDPANERSGPVPASYGAGVRDACDASGDDASPMNSPLPPLSAADRGSARLLLSPRSARYAPMNADASNPALHFGREVQRARIGAGMTLAEMGRVVGYHKSQISRVERGARAPTKKFAQMCDHAFPGRGGWFLRFYKDSRQWSAMPPWFRNWIEHEQRAVNLRIWQPSSLSGLLQSEAYALAQLRTFPGATADQVVERLRARMARQTILTREMPAAPMVWFLIDEAALRRRT